jgi:hypothetical protein
MFISLISIGDGLVQTGDVGYGCNVYNLV